MVVSPSDWSNSGLAGMTLKRGTDGMVHFYRTGTTTDVVVPCSLAYVSSISITGRDNLADALTVDFGGGNPIPAGGATFNGGAGTGNSLSIVGVAGDDNVTMSATQITDNGSAPITYSNVAFFGFSLGTGTNSLLIDHATLNLDQNNAISAGTTVTVDGGILNCNAYAQAIGDLTVKNGGQVNAAAISTTTTTVNSGTLTANSIVCDTLTIGSTSGASAGSEQSPVTAASLTIATLADPATDTAAPAASDASKFAADIPQLAPMPAATAIPQETIAVAATGTTAEATEISTAVRSSSPAAPLSNDSLSAIVLDPTSDISSIAR